jgi:hypothetical protein
MSRRFFGSSKTSSTSQAPEIQAGGSGLEERVTAFAQQIIATTNAVLPGGPHSFSVTVGGQTEQRVIISQEAPKGIPLTVDGETLFYLVIEYQCQWNTDRKFFAVDNSHFSLSTVYANEPLFHFDYIRSPGRTIPGAHINIHAHRDEVVYAMAMAGKKNRGKNRAKALEQMKSPGMSTLHFPVGGHRFRPCLEDVLQMVILEFGIDVLSGSTRALEEGRSIYRATQLKSAITDDLELAAEVLRANHYMVETPSKVPKRRDDRFKDL